MSIYDHLKCTDCKEYLWIGDDNRYIYKSEEAIEDLEAFLLKHKSHCLYNGDDNDDETGYSEFIPKKDKDDF